MTVRAQQQVPSSARLPPVDVPNPFDGLLDSLATAGARHVRMRHVQVLGFLTTTETARTLRISLFSIQQGIAKGRIPAVRYGGRWRIPVAWLYDLERQAFARLPPDEQARFSRPELGSPLGGGD